MRVIAGTYRGRRLDAPTWEGLRPTSDRLRETLFNILATRVPDARVADICAGTGAVGIEALSRGANWVTFVEQDRRAIALIEANLRRCQVGEGYTVDRRDALSPTPYRGGPFDIVFLDPPYAQRALDPWLHAAAASVTADGLVVLEHATRVSAPAEVGTLRRTRVLVQGDSSVTFYAVTAGEA
ncbi:MAG TPA: 16S rRNA (guanine(966)-N(2))-methyltransferase RsmD [Luteitalea sp.]|nr:16S rRNA (guanine(966)-N(2))-methyltransferase RsmD [Luteitalea sp.]